MKNNVDQAKTAMHLLYKRIRNLNLPIDLQIKLFDHTIVPILLYGCEVWGCQNVQIIENLHNDFYVTYLILGQEAHGPRVAHLSDIATADLQMLCNIFPILSSQLLKRSSLKQFLILKKNIYGIPVNGSFEQTLNGGQLGFTIGTILAIFDLRVIPMLHTKFRVNWSFGSGEKAKNRFLRWLPWRPSWISD